MKSNPCTFSLREVYTLAVLAVNYGSQVGHRHFDTPLKREKESHSKAGVQKVPPDQQDI
jgi:hypothetical protein